MDIIENCITSYFGKRNFHIGQGEWDAVARKVGHQWVFPLAPTAGGYAKLGEYFADVGNYDLEVLSTQPDFEEIPDVAKVPDSNKEGKNRTNIIENDVANLKDTFARSITRGVNMFSGIKMLGREKMSRGLKEIGKLNMDEECLMELNAIIGELENRIAIIDKSATEN